MSIIAFEECFVMEVSSLEKFLAHITVGADIRDS